jgi:hypothetical protein
MKGAVEDGWVGKAISLKSMCITKKKDEFLNLFGVRDVLILGVLR